MPNNEAVVIPEIVADPRVPATPYRITTIRSLVMIPIGTLESVAILGAYRNTLIFLDEASNLSLETFARQATQAVARISNPENRLQTADHQRRRSGIGRTHAPHELRGRRVDESAFASR